jgi:hypothetical protein
MRCVDAYFARRQLRRCIIYPDPEGPLRSRKGTRSARNANVNVLTIYIRCLARSLISKSGSYIYHILGLQVLASCSSKGSSLQCVARLMKLFQVLIQSAESYVILSLPSFVILAAKLEEILPYSCYKHCRSLSRLCYAV